MTETPLRDQDLSTAGAWLMRSLPGPNRSAGPPEPIRLQDLPKESSPGSVPSDAVGTRRDWSASLDLIHEATAAIRISEDRANELELELARTVAQAQERATALEAQIKDEKNRAEIAERRAEEAEDWLIRMHDAVVKGFTRKDPVQA